MDKKNDPQSKLIQVVRDAIQRDQEFREKYQVGEKFRFIRDRLHALLKRLEEDISNTPAVLKITSDEKNNEKNEEEIIVYVYLFNAQGITLRSWQSMLTPNLLYEYNINRPIYVEKAHVEALLRSKSNKVQHAYFSIAIHRNNVLHSAEQGLLKDSLGNPVVKIKEKTLHFNKFHSLFHNDQEYVLNEEKELIKKIIKI